MPVTSGIAGEGGRAAGPRGRILTPGIPVDLTPLVIDMDEIGHCGDIDLFDHPLGDQHLHCGVARHDNVISPAPGAQHGNHRLHAVIVVDMDLDATVGLEFCDQIMRCLFPPSLDEQIPFSEAWGGGQEQNGKGTHGGFLAALIAGDQARGDGNQGRSKNHQG